MSEIPSELRYTESHEWVRRMDDGHLEVGITDHAQEQLGDIVFVELPEVGITASAGDECSVIESVKAATDIYSPVNGEIVEVNQELEDAPNRINHEPYSDGWIFRLRPEDEEEWSGLLDADAYEELIETS